MLPREQSVLGLTGPTASTAMSGMGRGQRFGALLAGGLGGMGQGMMSPEFRKSYQLGAGGVEEAETMMDAQEKVRQQYQRDRDEFTERRRLGRPRGITSI